MKNRIKNNNGVTLIELIIVIAIISVATGAVIMGASFLTNSRVKKAYNIFQGKYSEARTNTMSKKNAVDLTISYRDNTFYLDSGNGEEEILTNPYTITYVAKNGSGNEMTGELGKDGINSITIKFKRATGGMDYLYQNGKDTANKTDYSLCELHIGNKVLYFTPETGRYSTEESSVKGDDD